MLTLVQRVRNSSRSLAQKLTVFCGKKGSPVKTHNLEDCSLVVSIMQHGVHACVSHDSTGYASSHPYRLQPCYYFDRPLPQQEAAWISSGQAQVTVPIWLSHGENGPKYCLASCHFQVTAAESLTRYFLALSLLHLLPMIYHLPSIYPSSTAKHPLLMLSIIAGYPEPCYVLYSWEVATVQRCAQVREENNTDKLSVMGFRTAFLQTNFLVVQNQISKWHSVKECKLPRL